MQQNEQLTNLVKRAVKGDREAMSDLYTHTCQRTYRTILGLVRDEQAAQDLTQETYMAAFSGLKRLEDPARFQPWLISTAVHKSKNHLRSSRPLLFSELEEGAVPEELPDTRAEASPELSLDRAETTRIVRELLGELNDSQKLAVELYYYDQLSTAEIAHSLDIPQSTVKTQLHYARKKLEAGLRRLQSRGVDLGGLTAAGCFGLLHALPEEPLLPRKEAEAMLSKILAQTPVQVAAKTSGQLLRGAIGKFLVGAAAMAAVGGIVVGALTLLKQKPKVGDYQPTQTVTAQQEDEDLQSSQYSRDFDSLWTILEQDYPYLSLVVPQAEERESLRSYYRQQAAMAKTTEDYLGVIRSLTETRLGLAGSLRVITPEMFQVNFTDVTELASTGSANDAAWAAVLMDPKLSPLYGNAREEDSRTENDVTSAMTGTELPTVRYYEDRKAIYLLFSYCNADTAQRDSAFIAKTLDDYPEAQHLIIDLRGNHGGDACYWEEVLLNPLGGNWSWNTRVYYRDTPLTAPFYADTNSVPAAQLSDAPDWVEQLELDRCYFFGLESHSALPERDLKRWVLTNGKTYSGAAWLAAFCRGSGWGTVLGEPTATGFGLSGTAVAALLPETGLLLQFGDVVETPDGDPDALTGVLPDISCASGNALDTCLNLIDLEETPYNAAAFPRSGEQKIVR